MEPRPHVAGIGVVGMDPIGQTRCRQQRSGQEADQFIEVGPELLLGQVGTGTEGDAVDRKLGPQLLLGLGVVGANGGIVDAAGDHLHPFHLRPLG